MVATVRTTRTESSFRVVDLTNAGKRGATCREIVLYDIDFVHDPAAWGRIYDAITAITTDMPFDEVATILRGLAKTGGSYPLVDERNLRGVDVAPADFTPVEARGAKVYVKAEWGTFTVRDLLDRNNEPTLIPPTRAPASSVVKFRKFAAEHVADFATMSFSEVWDAMRAAGIGSHYFCAMD